MFRTRNCLTNTLIALNSPRLLLSDLNCAVHSFFSGKNTHLWHHSEFPPMRFCVLSSREERHRSNIFSNVDESGIWKSRDSQGQWGWGKQNNVTEQLTPTSLLRNPRKRFSSPNGCEFLRKDQERGREPGCSNRTRLLVGFLSLLTVYRAKTSHLHWNVSLWLTQLTHGDTVAKSMCGAKLGGYGKNGKTTARWNEMPARVSCFLRES